MAKDTMTSYCCGCRHKASHTESVILAYEKVKLSEPLKYIVGRRMKDLLYEYRDRSFRYSFSFHLLRIMITIGSLIVPALLSVQYMDGNVSLQSATMSAQVYWIVWVLSLFVTMSNGIMTLLKIDKKHFVMNTTFQHLLSESWQYVELSGRYAIGNHDKENSYDSQYLTFCHQLEKIRMKQVQDEYFKVPEQEPKVGNPSLEIMPMSPPSNFPKPKVNGSQVAEEETDSKTTIRRQISDSESKPQSPFQTQTQTQSQNKTPSQEKNGLSGTAFESIPRQIIISDILSPDILADHLPKPSEFAEKSGDHEQPSGKMSMLDELSERSS